MANRASILLLREYLRQPENRVSPADSVARHQKALSQIWNKALSLSGGNAREALETAVHAVRSVQQEGESREQFVRRMDGVPSKAFGTQGDQGGVDKAQHFFRSAQLAYDLSNVAPDSPPGYPDPAYGERMARAAGRAYEAADEGGASVEYHQGGYSPGDVAANDRGASFGARLVMNDFRPDIYDKPDIDSFLPDLEPDAGEDADSPPDFNMETFHQSHEGADTAEAEVEPGTGPLSNEALGQRGDSTKPEVAPGTGPPSNEALGQRGDSTEQEIAPGTGPLSNEALDHQEASGGPASGGGMPTHAESPSGEQQPFAPAADELRSVSEQYAPASDELDVERAPSEGEPEPGVEGPYGPASDELAVETQDAQEQVDYEQVDYEQVEYQG